MQQSIFRELAPIRFKHFTRKGYSLFACLGREVIVCTLSVATLTHARAEGISVRTENAIDTLQRSELKLDEVVITGSRAPLTLLESAKIVTVITREDVQRAAAATVNDILKLVPGVDVRQRGGYGVQTDISVRGGNFDQITILLNGVPVSSPQTGHLSADFPISSDDIERIEVLEGPAARVYGAQAFNGVVNIVTVTSRPSDGLNGYAHMSAGSYGYANANAALHYGGASLSGGYTRTDGATPNSAFTSSRLFFNGNAQIADNVKLSAQAGYSYKPYEANTFYGASSTDQWESNERIMAAANADVKLSAFHITPQLYWNRWFDHYQWHRDSPVGENFHRTDNYGAGISAWVGSSFGRTSFGFDVKYDEIWSTKLGRPADSWHATGGHDSNADVMYKFRDKRENLSAFIEHNIILDQWTVSLGLLANKYNSYDNKWRFFPGIDVSWRPAALLGSEGRGNLELFASWNQAMRLPTFTDLYYSGAGIEGNSNLKAEKTSDIQLGARYLKPGIRVDAQYFYSHKSDMIDWVNSGDGTFRSVNFQMDNSGIELNAQWLPREIYGQQHALRSLSVKYSYIDEKSKYDVVVVQSKYAMDFLRHKVVVAADGRLWKSLNASLSWRWQERTGNDNPSYALLDCRISWDAPRFSLYADATNVLNKHYADYSFIPQPGRVLMFGVKCRM